MKYFAAITGDIIQSQKIKNKKALIKAMENIFREVEAVFEMRLPFEIYRGDSFQGLLNNPVQSLRVAYLLRTGLMARAPKDEKWDVRIAIGIGKVDFLSNTVKTSQGNAFVLAGSALEEMKKYDRIKIRMAARDEANRQTDVMNRLADALSMDWHRTAAEVIYLRLMYKWSQTKMAEHLGISQAAVHKRLRRAHFDAVEYYIRYFEQDFMPKILENA